MWRIIQQQQAEIDELKRQNEELRGQQDSEKKAAPAAAGVGPNVQDPSYDEALATPRPKSLWNEPSRCWHTH